MPEDKPKRYKEDKERRGKKKVSGADKKRIKSGIYARNYWKNAGLKDMIDRVNMTEDFINQKLAGYYNEAKAEILKEIEAFYKKYAKESGLTLIDAKRKISAADFNGIDFEGLAKEAAISGDKELTGLLDSLSKKGQITRLENLNLEIDRILSGLYNNEQTSTYEYLAGTYTDDYYKSVYNLNKFLGLRTDFTAISEKIITKAVTEKWSKRHFSKAIWGHRDNLSEDLRSVITKHLIKGSSLEKMSKELSVRCDVAFSNAKRLARTESSRIHNQTTLNAYKNEAKIEKYKFLATLDFKTSTLCRSLDGQILETSAAKIGVNCPPMHPNCRSTLVPAPESDYVGLRIARDGEGKTYYVPADMKYHEWYKSIPEEKRKKMELERKKAVNLTSDKAQYEKYKEAFKNGVDIKDKDGAVISKKTALPRSFADFQKLKYESGDWDKYKAEFRAINLDAKQLENFKTVLGEGKLPKTVVKFRELKYNDTNAFKRLEANYNNEVKAAKFRRLIDSGEVNLNVRVQKQKEHILGSKQWFNRVKESAKKGENLENAFYTDIDIQKLINENAGKGNLKFKRNDIYPREYFKTDEFVGIVYNKDLGKYIKSKEVAVHYSSKGTHAYPVKRM